MKTLKYNSLNINLILKAAFLIAVFSVFVLTMPTNAFADSVSTQPATDVTTKSATGHGYVLSDTAPRARAWIEWGEGGSLDRASQSMTTFPPGSFYGYMKPLEDNKTYSFRAAAEIDGIIYYGSRRTFKTPSRITSTIEQIPNVITKSATNVSPSFANLNGYVNPYDAVNSQRWFEWGQTQSLGKSTPRQNQGTSPADFSYSITGLKADSLYYFRAAAQSTGGLSYGNTLILRTQKSGYDDGSSGTTVTIPPTSGDGLVAVTKTATSITETNSTINGLAIPGTVNLKKGWFEWGSTPSLGNTTQKKSLGTGSFSEFSDTLTGLASGKAYFYKAVAEDQSGIKEGAVISFITKGVATTYTPPVHTTPSVTTPIHTEKPTVSVQNETQKETLKDTEKNGDKKTSLLAGVFGSGKGDEPNGLTGFFPDTLLGWLWILLLILVIVALSSNVYGGYKKRKDERRIQKKENEIKDIDDNDQLGGFRLPGQ